MSIPENLKYTEQHEWIRVEENTAIVGITEYAQGELGDIVFVEVDTVGEKLEKEEIFGTVEAVKTVSDLFMPISGEIIEFNTMLEDDAELINKDPYGEGWMIRISLDKPEELDRLLSHEQYKELIES